MANTFNKRGLMIGGSLITVGGWFAPDILKRTAEFLVEIPQQPVRFAIVVIGIGLVLFAIRENVMDAFGIYTARRLSEKIRTYLHLEKGYSIVSSLFTDKDAFEMVVALDQYQATIVKRHKSRALEIILNTSTFEEHKDLVIASSELEQSRLTNDATLELLRMKSFDNIQASINDGTFEMQANMRIPIDAKFNETILMNAIADTSRAYSIIAIVWGMWCKTRTELKKSPVKQIGKGAKS